MSNQSQPPAVPYLSNLASYQNLVNLLDPQTLMVLDFTANWCGPCRKISPYFQQMQQEYPQVCFRKVDVDQSPDIAELFGVSSMPTFVFLKGGNVLNKFSGANPQQLRVIVHTLSQPVA